MHAAINPVSVGDRDCPLTRNSKFPKYSPHTKYCRCLFSFSMFRRVTGRTKLQTRKVARLEAANATELMRVIKSQHGAEGTFTRSVRVQAAGSCSDWDGLVHIFDLKDHPNAKRAFAWSSRIAGTPQSRFFAVLQSGRIATPLQAVKAASAAIQKWGAKGTP